MEYLRLKYFLFLFILLNSCIEEIPLQQEEALDDVLVVEATITNEFKNQVIKLTRAFRLDETEPKPETNATVKVIDENGTTFNFSETENGVYISNDEFAAQVKNNYHLEIETSNGINYSSSNESFIKPTHIDNLYIERDFNENEEEGISIYVDTADPTNSSKYYRYVYEETYKIIAPRYSPFKLIDLDGELPVPVIQFSSIQEIQDYLVELVLRDKNVEICYNTVKSNTILTTNTNSFPEDKLEKHRIRFISRQNYIISHRYTILVNQYVQSSTAHNFYETLKSFSISESVFSENQVGFLEGNISSLSKNKKVVGFFEVSPVDTKRIYFNYADEFPGEELPPYYTRCDDEIYPRLFKVDPLTQEITESFLINAMDNDFIFANRNEGNNPDFLPIGLYPFILVTKPCGDCTALGTTIVPDFWEE